MTFDADKDLKGMSLAELEQLSVGLAQKKYIAKYIFSFIHNKTAEEISQISPLSKAFRNQLIDDGYYISNLRIVEKLVDADGTVKYLFELFDKNTVEAVVLSDGKRKTVCVSTQVGCAVNCQFCATGKLKFKRNLTVGEILDQVYIAGRDNGRISNVVYMGMGEPMYNYDNVIKSVKLLIDPAGQNFAIRHLTISTCGIGEGILKLADEDIRPRLAVSLNAAFDSIRTKLMPINKSYSLSELLKALRVYQLRTKQRVTIEYVLLKDVNDSDADAEALARILKSIKCNVNLIGYNAHPGSKFQASTKAPDFASILTRAGIETIIRAKMGAKIKAACGQLGADKLK
ncbi:23S rRNA (adenine(2503)-C(2))-methyltransferase RlmN [Planctomycetota bacterium]